MFPTLNDKQILLGMTTNKYNIGDVVVAKVEGDLIIKRIKYKEGDEIYNLINDKLELPIIITKENYENHKKTKFEIVQKLTIEKNRFYLLGDNPNQSDDSRRFGSVSLDSIKYKIIFPRL